MSSLFVSIVVLVLTLLFLASLAYYYLTYYFNYWRTRGIEGPHPQLLVGTFPKTSAGQLNLIEELHDIYLQYRGKYPFVGVFTSRKPKLFILEPKLANEVLSTHFKHFHDNESSRWTTPRVEALRLCSPFVSTGDQWRQQRTELTPALTLNKVRLHHATLQRSSKKLLKYLSVKSKDGASLDAKELANRFTANFMGQFIWNTEVDSLNEFKSDRELSPIHCMAEEMTSQALRCVEYYARTAAWPWVRFFQPVRFFTAASERFFRKMARDAFKLREGATLSTSADVIGHLFQLSTKKPLSEIQITGHTTTVLIDGYETGAMLIANTLLMLARHESVQEKLRQELKAAGMFLDLDHEVLSELPYLEQCLQETLRLLPPLPTLFKLCTQDIVLPFGDGCSSQHLQLHAGDSVYISSYSFHHDDKYFEYPEEFRPERFDSDLGGVRQYRDSGVFLPFGAGPRMCPGMKLGLTEAKYAVSAIVSHFHITSSPMTRWDNKLAPKSFLLAVDGGIQLKFDEISTESIFSY